jgi:hypothetical protein
LGLQSHPKAQLGKEAFSSSFKLLEGFGCSHAAAEGHSWFLATWPLQHCGLLHQRVINEKNVKQSINTEVMIFCNLVTEVTSCCFFLFHLSKSQLRGAVYIQEEGITQREVQEDHFDSCLPKQIKAGMLVLKFTTGNSRCAGKIIRGFELPLLRIFLWVHCYVT